jgi:VanZ family protein
MAPSSGPLWWTNPRHWRVLFWLAAVAGVVLSLWPQYEPHEAWFDNADKVAHALAFAGLAVLGRLSAFRSVAALAAGLLVLGGAIEVAQGLFTVTRSADWLDWLADSIGIAAGLGVSALLPVRRVSAALE